MSQASVWTRREVWTRKLLYPGHTFPTAAAPVIVAIGLAHHDRVFAALPVALAFLAGWLIQFAGVVTDNYSNLKREPDDREHPELVQAVNSGLLSLADLRNTILVSYGLAVLFGFALLALAGWPVIVIGLASILASWAYSAGPWPFGRHGFADPLFFLFFGTVSVIGAYYVQAAVVLGTGALARGAAAHRGGGQPADRRADHQYPDHRRYPRLRVRHGEGQEHGGGALRQNLEPV